MAQPDTLRNNVTASQCDKILAWLKAGKPITPLVALNEFGCNRLAARVADLRAAGHPVQSRMITVFNRDGGKCRVAEYRLEGDAHLQIDMAEVWDGAAVTGSIPGAAAVE